MKFGGKRKAITVRLSVSNNNNSYNVNMYYTIGNHHVDKPFGLDGKLTHEAKVFTQLLRCLYVPESGTQTMFDGCLVRLCKANAETVECFKYALKEAADICRITVVERI